MSHTPGPWSYRFASYRDDLTFEVADSEGPYWIAQVRTEDDARLIASAPALTERVEQLERENAELRTALKGIENYPCKPADDIFMRGIARDALARHEAHDTFPIGVKSGPIYQAHLGEPASMPGSGE